MERAGEGLGQRGIEEALIFGVGCGHGRGKRGTEEAVISGLGRGRGRGRLGPNSNFQLGQQSGSSSSIIVPSSLSNIIQESPIQHFPEPNPLLEVPSQDLHEADRPLNLSTIERGRVRGQSHDPDHNETKWVTSYVDCGRVATMGPGRGGLGPNSPMMLGRQSSSSNPIRSSPHSNLLENDSIQNLCETEPSPELRTNEKGRGRGRAHGQHVAGSAVPEVCEGRGHGRRGGHTGVSRSSNTFMIPSSSSNSVSVDDGAYDSFSIPNNPNLPGVDPPNEINPAPAPPPLFTQQASHRSALVIRGEKTKPLIARKHCLKSFDMHDKYEDYIVNAGFYGLYKIGHICADSYLITALVERWRPETHTFHLPVGEMMVTLQDVAIILGLPIDGEPVIPENNKLSTEEWHSMIREYLGCEVDEKTFRSGSKTAINISWLKGNFKKLTREEMSNEEYEVKTQCYVRALILMMLGSLLFTDLSGDSISVTYLPFLKDLSKVGNYSWGSATLAYLNRELCRTCRIPARQIGGPLLLLQIWSWERFLIGRPKIRPGEPIPTLGGFNHRPELRPSYGYLWSGLHAWTENPGKCLQYYRDEIDYLREYQVNWEPYSREDLDLLPPICTASMHLWDYSGPLIHFWMVEPHNTRRVLRQFGKYQNYPPTPCNLDPFECTNKNPGGSDNWAIRHAMYVSQWTNRANWIFEELRDYDSTTYDNYMEWYANNSRRYLQPEKVIRPEPGPLRDLLYQVRAGVTHITAKKIKDIGQECKKKIEEEGEGSLKEFSLKILRELKDVLVIINEFVPGDEIFAPLNEVQNQGQQEGAGTGEDQQGRGRGGQGRGRGRGSIRPTKRQRIRGG
ncbi:hypothetical protein LUZ60_016493 [Juncus effusus]|nr:hypothetical protein LUZ60_016493 [Juncus effusus]